MGAGQATGKARAEAGGWLVGGLEGQEDAESSESDFSKHEVLLRMYAVAKSWSCGGSGRACLERTDNESSSIFQQVKN